MTVARRLDALETSLNPTQLVLRWLAEAHAHGSLIAHADALLDLMPGELPLNRLCHSAARGARESVNSRQPEQVARAVRQALRETVFRYLLALRINVVAHELLEREQLRHALQAALLALAANGDRRNTASERESELLVSVVQAIARSEQELDDAAEARRLAGERYLDGASALFPDVAGAWDEQREGTRQLREMADRLAEIEGVDVSLDSAGSTGVGERLADLVEVAKVQALEKLGEEDRAVPIALDWLRTKRDARLGEAESALTL